MNAIVPFQNIERNKTNHVTSNVHHNDSIRLLIQELTGINTNLPFWKVLCLLLFREEVRKDAVLCLMLPNP